MPGGDRTGPRGLGPRTGRSLGYCAGYDAPGSFYGPGFGYGLGRGRGIGWNYGRGRGYGRGWGYRGILYPPPSPFISRVPLEPGDNLTVLKEDKDYLESEIKRLSSALEEISKNIEELETKE